jgi:uncharacterized secreted protein with C-terminal beta-propeller domain
MSSIRTNAHTTRFRAAAAAFTMLVLVGCGEGSVSDPPAPQAEAPGLLRRVTSDTELENLLKSAIRAAPSTDQLAVAVAAPAAAFSGTYTQEARVDEADTVRYDGSLLFVAPSRSFSCCFVADPLAAGPANPPPLPDRSIRILRTNPTAATASPVGRIPLESGVSVQGLYTTGDRLVALTSEAYFGTFGQFWIGLPYWAPRKFGLRIFDIVDPVAPRTLFTASLDGTFVDSRRVGDRIYVVSRYAPRVLLDAPGRAAADSASLASLLPQITVNGASRPLVDPLRCYVTNDASDSDSAVITSITVIPVSNPGDFTTTCYNEDAYGLYMSEQSIYLTQYRVAAGVPGSGSGQRTRIHRFEISGAAPVYRGSAEIDGAVWTGGQADFRMSEANGLLRVMTSDAVNDATDNVDHRLYVLRQSSARTELEIVGQLPNSRRPEEIGKPNESLFGVRFLADRAFAATFRRIDPLYAFDLTDPTDPRIAGSLELPGFSDLLHPVSASLLLGIGQADNGGVRVALFDVSRLDQPREVGGYTYGAAGTYSEARHDRHAFAYLAHVNGVDHFAVPVNLYSSDGQYRFISSSLQLFEVRNKTQPASTLLIEAGRVVARTTTSQVPAYPVACARAFLHPTSVFFVADDEVLGASWAQPALVNGPY